MLWARVRLSRLKARRARRRRIDQRQRSCSRNEWRALPTTIDWAHSMPRALAKTREVDRTPHDGVTSRHLVCATTQTKEAMEMPKVSRDSAPQRQDAGPVVDLRAELDGYTVSFTSLLEDIDATPLLKGLPDDRCPCPHWGYVIKGKMTARYADRDEVFEAGDAFYTPPGHIPVANEPGTEFVWFSPSEELRSAEAV